MLEQNDRIRRSFDPVSGEERRAPHEHKVRPVAVVPFAHDAPVAWICPTCWAEVLEPAPLGPILEGRFQRSTLAKDEAPAPTPLQRRTGYTPGQAPPSRTLFSNPRVQHQWEEALSRSREVDNESLAKDGWRREPDGSLTQLAKPVPTRITASAFASGGFKPVETLEVEYEDLYDIHGNQYRQARIR